ncbi:MAG: hypothetical protein KDD64_05115, partial [Bdellovibrionales bacterium]|nr:hypothetical protein [Bdellovibrionales bacterium]
VHEGVRIQHQKLVTFLHRNLRQNATSGKWVVRVGKGEAEVSVEDVPYFVVDFNFIPEACFATLITREEREIDPMTFAVGQENQMYCSVSGLGLARLRRSAHQQIASLVTGDDQITLLNKVYRIRKIDR